MASTAGTADGWLTVAEVARRLRLSPSTLRWWRHKGRGPLSVPLAGGHHKYKESAVAAWEAEQEAAALASRERWTETGRRAS